MQKVFQEENQLNNNIMEEDVVIKNMEKKKTMNKIKMVKKNQISKNTKINMSNLRIV